MMVGSMESGIEIERTKSGGIILKEYVDGEMTGEVTVNYEEIEELIGIFKTFQSMGRRR